ncbi:leucine-rich repeat protein [Cetobacterium sp.]|uniref:leucine-rich repeat protein n=1 Tax=Cetobacterium sp. TaxID=2071632 RepID=UPI003F3AB34C
MAKHFINLKKLNLNNTTELTGLKANVNIESVTLENSKILEISSFQKRVPEPLLSRNNMANYTQVKVNGVLISAEEVAKLKLGKMNVEHNDKIEVVDGVLAGTIFTVILGVPLNTLIKDSNLMLHIKELLNKESITSLVDQADLNSISWIGRDPSTITAVDYLGFFNTKTIVNYDIFKEDLKMFPNLSYINLSGAIFSNTIDFNDYPNITNFKYSFANCITLENVTINKDIDNLECTFKNCQNLRNVTIGPLVNTFNNADNTFYNCKGLASVSVNNPNFTCNRALNTFEESLINRLTFAKEPVDNVITSQFVKDALEVCTTLDLTGKNRPDLYNLTLSENIKLERIVLNNTNIEELDFNKSNINYINLKHIEAENTTKLYKVVLVGTNLIRVTITNAPVLSQSSLEATSPPLLKDNKNYYDRLALNGVELTPSQVTDIKNGNYLFVSGDIIKILDGPLQNIELSFKVGIPVEGMKIIECFPDPVVAEHIKLKLNKSTTDDIIKQRDIDTIEYFGCDSLENISETSSWFFTKSVNDWTGVGLLRNIKTFHVARHIGQAREIKLNSTKLINLNYAFYGCTHLTNICLPSTLPDLLNMNFAFYGCQNLVTDILINAEKLNKIDYTFHNCTKLRKVEFLSNSSLITSLNDTFYNCYALEVIKLPNIMNLLTSMSKTFENCIKLTSFNFPNELNKLITLNFTFKNCQKLQFLTFPTTLPLLERMDNTFEDCSSFSLIRLPNSFPELKTLESTFKNCINLSSLNIPETLPKITSIHNMLYGCIKLTGNLILNDTPNLTNFNAIENSGIEFFEIKKLNKEVNYNLDRYFTGNLKIKRIIFPTDLETITSMTQTFKGCTALTSLTLPSVMNNVTDISEFLNGCVSMSGDLVLPPMAKLTTFAGAFSNTNFTSITFTNLDSITTLKNYFVTSQNSIDKPNVLRKIVFPNNMNSLINLEDLCCYYLTDLATSNGLENLQEIILPTIMLNVENMNRTFYKCTSLTRIELPARIPKLTTTLAQTYIEDGSRTYVYHKDDSVSEYSHITLFPTIGTKDFTRLINIKTYAQNIEDPILRDYLKSFVNFNDNDITDANIFNDIISLTDFPNGILNFEGLKCCKNLEHVSFKNNETYTNIDISAINNIKNLKQSFENCINLESLSLPNNLENLIFIDDMIKNCNKLNFISLTNFNNKILLNKLIKLIDKERRIIEIKNDTNITNFNNLKIVEHIKKSTISISESFSNKSINFYFNEPLKTIIKNILNISDETTLIDINRFNTITDLTLNINQNISDDISFLLLKELTSLTISNNVINTLDLKYAKKLNTININNCINLKLLKLCSFNYSEQNININITGTNILEFIYANKNINLDFIGLKKNF